MQSAKPILPFDLAKLISYYLPFTVTKLTKLSSRFSGLSYIISKASAQTGLSIELLQNEIKNCSNVDLVLAKYGVVGKEFEDNNLIGNDIKVHLIAQFGNAQQIKKYYNYFNLWDIYHAVIRHHDFGAILLSRLAKKDQLGKKLAIIDFISKNSKGYI